MGSQESNISLLTNPRQQVDSEITKSECVIVLPQHTSTTEPNGESIQSKESLSINPIQQDDIETNLTEGDNGNDLKESASNNEHHKESLAIRGNNISQLINPIQQADSETKFTESEIKVCVMGLIIITILLSA